jgi:hypothetical protein
MFVYRLIAHLMVFRNNLLKHHCIQHSSSTNMASTSTFPFLSLPKELRLMVYSNLPIRTTHRPLISINGHLIHTTLPGVTILATCREIATEARSILAPKLEAIKSSPVRLVTTDLLQDHLVKFLRCLATSETTYPARKHLHESRRSNHAARTQHGTTTLAVQHVCIVLCNTATAPRVTASGLLFKLATFEYELNHIVKGPRMRRLNIQVRAMLRDEDRAAWVDASFVDEQQHSLLWSERRGELFLPMVKMDVEVGAEEWVREWQEGERE